MNKGKYQIIQGDVTNPVGEGIKIIPHIISDLGVCGAGVAKTIVEKWPDVKLDILSTKGRYGELVLGICVRSWAENNEVIVISMVAQKGLRSRDNLFPIRYAALTDCMRKVLEFVSNNNYSIHCSKFGSGLAGGDWNFIEALIKEIWVDNGIDVTVYEYRGG
jgi:hypothetical protein